MLIGREVFKVKVFGKTGFIGDSSPVFPLLRSGRILAKIVKKDFKCL